jgi:diguanylate cyclase (GGDEF)-like protein
MVGPVVVPSMTDLRFFRQLFAVPDDNPELMQSQLTALTFQIPLLYFILISNTIAVAYTHHGIASVTQTVFLPLVFSIFGSLRAWKWLKLRKRVLEPSEIATRLRSTVRLTIGLGICVTAWGFSLFPYGGPLEQGHVAFYMAVTVVACILCLLHLRAAALGLTLIVVIPFSVFFGFSGNTVFVAMAANVLLVAAAMVIVLLTQYRDFSSLISMQKQLVLRQEETQRLSDENHRLANLDSLTGLPNRRYFFSELERAVANAAANDKRLIFGLFDLDGFKAVNDLYGHAVGDRLLVEASRRLADSLLPGMVFARLGGDEFGLLITADFDKDEVLHFARSLCSILGAPYQLDDVHAEISASAGLAIHPQSARTIEGLVEHADYALYHAKNSQRGSPVLFTRDHKTKMHKLSLLEQRLRQADFSKELWLAYQPIVDVKTGRTRCFEALARWSDPILGQVPPDLFIKAAERSELVNRITEVLLRRALAEAKSWPADIRISFNLSARNLASSETVLRIISIINESKIRPDRIDLEITETVLMADFDNARDKLHALRRLGPRISLDDFGSGYSSLSYVHRLQFDKIKIDRGFITGIAQDPKSLNVIKTVVDLSRNLDLDCVVEGVETEEQFDIIRELGCDMAQGYFSGRPMPGSDVVQYLEAEARRHSRPQLVRIA